MLRRAQDKDLVTIPIEVEYFFSFMFGKQSTHGLAGHYSIGEWNRLCKRLMEHLEKYIAANVETDRAHLRMIKQRLDSMEKALTPRARHSREPLLLRALSELILLLLGDMPDHWDKKTVNRPEYYRLDHRRRLQYYQSRQQKINLILFACRNYQETRLNDDENKQIRIQARKLKGADFLDWFRVNHRETYGKIF